MNKSTLFLPWTLKKEECHFKHECRRTLWIKLIKGRKCRCHGHKSLRNVRRAGVSESRPFGSLGSSGSTNIWSTGVARRTMLRIERESSSGGETFHSWKITYIVWRQVPTQSRKMRLNALFILIMRGGNTPRENGFIQYLYMSVYEIKIKTFF